MPGTGGGLPVATVLALAMLAAPAAAQSRPPERPSPAAVAGRSLVLPGWGQWSQGQRRAVAYAAVEAVLWAFWADRRSGAADSRRDYRDLAWRSGRIAAGERQDGGWAYYEALSKWSRSGAFDRDASVPGLQPEDDPTTFNGSAWALAKGMYFRGGTPGPGDAAYESALGWYRGHAYGDGFLWDWTGRERDLTRYRQLILDSDDRFREATAALGAVLGNHLLSGTDAFVSARIPGSAALRVTGPPPGARPLLGLTLTWRPGA